MSGLRVAVLGLGAHAVSKILPAVSATKGLELYGVCSRDARTVASCRQTWKCKGWTDAAEMLADPAVDIVYAASPIGVHAEQGRQILAARKHFWCEKSLTCDLKDALELLESAERAELSICEGLMYLHHPHFRRLSKYMSDGSLGSIRSVGCRFYVPKLEHIRFRSDPSLSGGALFDVGCYPVSAVLALFPNADFHIEYAKITARDNSPVDTDGHVLITLADSVVADLEWGMNRAYRNAIEIYGENGSVSTDKIFSKQADYVPVFSLRDVHGAERLELGEADNHFVSMLKYFTGTIGNAKAAAAERHEIARRAEGLDRISSRSLNLTGSN